MPVNPSPAWAVNIIHTCMAVQRGEKILVIVDEPLSYGGYIAPVEDSAEGVLVIGKSLAPIHIDGVVSQPALRVDGRVLVEKGETK